MHNLKPSRFKLSLLILMAPALAAISYDNASAAPDQSAIFAGGCFWCMEPPFDELKGVKSTTSGYTGGKSVNPTYEEVSAGGTGHREAVRVTYDPDQVSYAKLLEVFWANVDPTDVTGQFCDKGDQYRSAIYYLNDEQKRLALESKDRIEKSGKLSQPIVTQILPAGPFYPAEERHQDYYKHHWIKYKFYRFTCGRDARLREVWGK